MKISIIIPTYNEAGHIGALLHYLQQHTAAEGIEILVVDGGSTDSTGAEATAAGAQFHISPQKGRAAQMNYGASLSTGAVLYFLHADTFPPPSFLHQIQTAVTAGYPCGCFRLQFDVTHWFLKANCWFTRFNIRHFRFGDQSLFVEKTLFHRMGSFNEKLIVLEDQDMVRRLVKRSRFKVLTGAVTTSARKYLDNGIYKTQGIYFLIYFMWMAGFSQQKLLQTYRALINQNKL